MTITKKIIWLLIAMFLCNAIIAQQDVKLPGVVVELNSAFNTGKVIYLSNAEIKAAGAAPQLSDAQGEFTLIFADKPIGNVAKIYASKNGYEVVNHEVIKEAAVMGRNSPLKVVMCKADFLYENQIAYYNIGKEAALKSFDERMTILKKEGKEKDQLIAKMEKEFNQKITSVNLANNLLLNELQQTQEKARALADNFLTVNLDDESEEYKEAFCRFLDGDIDGAQQILAQINLAQRLETNTKEKKKEIAIISQAQKSVFKRDKQIIQDIANCIFKAQLHQIKFEYDEAADMYELALKYDSDNPFIQYEYALILIKQNKFNKAHPLLSKASQKYRVFAKIIPQVNLPKLAMTLNNLAIIHQRKNELDSAKNNFEEALAIRRCLVQVNKKRYEPELSETLNNLGMVNYSKEQYDTALVLLEECLVIRRELAVLNPNTYKHTVASTLGNILTVSISKFNLTQDENLAIRIDTTFAVAIKIYKGLPKNKSHLYKYKLASLLSNYGGFQIYQSESKKAVITLTKSLEIFDTLAKANPFVYEPESAGALINLGNAYTSLCDCGKAEQSLLKAVSILERYLNLNPTIHEISLANAYINLSNLYCNPYCTIDKNLSKEFAQKSLDIYKKYWDELPHAKNWGTFAKERLKKLGD